MDAARLCRHCRKAVISRPRRLCWVCHRTPDVRRLYPPMTPQEAGAIGGRKYRPSVARLAASATPDG